MILSHLFITSNLVLVGHLYYNRGVNIWLVVFSFYTIIWTQSDRFFIYSQ